MTSFDEKDGLLLIRIDSDRLDAAAAPAFKKALEDNVKDRPRHVVLDASKLDFLDSTGLGVFVSLLKMMGEPGILAIAGPKAAVRRLLQITQLDKIFRLYDQVEDAEAALRAA